ncbi:transient receptor potential channel pyrexia isoform X2 [Cephus cinctus]|uniref:Transient receptor potential channel pyrexia isoform X2 n=1 Tax=Cephus cinctus TaxID=211228 RepID=A0AAJ7W1E2_CEPCN|nr:transient receptor potential channel pyrexia isoform X2 [Cephus cinctus]
MEKKYKYLEIPTKNPDEDDKETASFKLATSLPLSRSYPASPSPAESLEMMGGPPLRRRLERRRMRLNMELIEAIVHNQLDEVKRISCCHIASFLGYTEILGVLLDNKAQLGAKDAMGRTPLHLTAWEGNPDCLKLLLSHAPHLVNVKTEEIFVKEKIPIEWLDSWEHDHQSVTNMLPKIEYGSTPLHVACKRTELICVQHLLDAGADLEITDSRGLRPLDVVGENLIEYREEGDVEFRFPEVIKALIKAGAQHYLSSEYDHHGYRVTPLHTAVELESEEAISVLLEANFPRGVWNANGETPMHVCILKKISTPLKLLLNIVNNEIPQNYLDPENYKGMTPLQTAVRENWVPGVSIILEAGADVTLTSRDGYTALHLAAVDGNVKIVQEILSIPDAQGIIEVQNQLGETPLFCAISSRNSECVTELLNFGCNLKYRMPGNITVFHRAAEYGLNEILTILLQKDSNITTRLINVKDELKMSGMTPMHMAAQVGNAECVETLIQSGADATARTTNEPHYNSTALHLAATLNHFDVVEVLLKHDVDLINLQDLHEWMPLHVACYHCSRECIRLLVNAGSDLSAVALDQERRRRTAIDFLVYNVPRPVEFLESIFDSAININEYTINEQNCLVTVDYQVLAPRGRGMEQMHVINSLMNTGNQFGQKRLLIHPLIESFLCLKWRTLSPIFMVTLAIYAVFVVATTQLITGIYYYQDNGEQPPIVLDVEINTYIMLVSLFPIVIQELLHANQRSWGYIQELESWVKWGSLIFSTMVVFLDHGPTRELTRHIAAVAVLLVWTELMFLLSRFPEWGYYVLMFSKVAINIIKVLLTFGFLVIGFTFSFLVQFRNEPPFGSPWQSFVKTMVMMTSEFDYSDLFTDREDYIVTLTLGRLVFVAFLVLAAIVLMNLMIGLAVNDINDLEIRGKTERLFKQVNFLCSLDSLVYNEFMLKYLPIHLRQRMERGRFVDTKMFIYPGRPLRTLFKMLPTSIKEEIIQKAIAGKRNEEPKLADVLSQLNEIRSLINSKFKSSGIAKETFVSSVSLHKEKYNANSEEHE